MRYLHFSSSCSGMHASRALFVMGHAQQIFFGLVSGILLAEAPIAPGSGGAGARRERGTGESGTQTDTPASANERRRARESDQAPTPKTKPVPCRVGSFETTMVDIERVSFSPTPRRCT